MTALFLSLRPVFADLILSGRKTVEVRRVIPRGAKYGSLILLYAAAPEKALWGLCFLDGVSVGAPETIWRKSGSGTGLRKRDFLAYLEGSKRAVALHVSKPVPFSRPIPLAEIRGAWHSFQPPQGFAYIAVPDIENLARGLSQRATGHLSN